MRCRVCILTEVCPISMASARSRTRNTEENNKLIYARSRVCVLSASFLRQTADFTPLLLPSNTLAPSVAVCGHGINLFCTAWFPDSTSTQTECTHAHKSLSVFGVPPTTLTFLSSWFLDRLKYVELDSYISAWCVCVCVLVCGCVYVRERK